MKRVISLLTITMMVILVLLNMGGTTFAEEKYSTEYYRVSNSTGNLSEEQRNSLDENCIKFIEKYKIDMVLIAVDAKAKGINDIEYSADGYYADCGFGYGKKKSGIMAIYDTSANKVHYTFYGKAKKLIPEKYIKFAADGAVEKLDEYGEFGVLYSALGYMRDYFEEHGTEPAKDSSSDENSTSGEGSESGNSNSADSGRSLPDWYPDDVDNFEFFSDPDAPRVVDVADIFTDSEEEELEALIKKSSAESGKDIVIFTDVKTYGFNKDIYAADFYDFNGYGFGKDREGVCLMICMDPDDRGWWACCTGPDTMALYTRDIADSVDDRLYEYMSNGDYAAGVTDWIKNMNMMFLKGLPFAPEWYPYRDTEFVRTNDNTVSRVVDYVGALTEEQSDELKARVKEMSGRLGYDIVLNFTDGFYGMDRDGYVDKFYEYNGYGFGENYDGIACVFNKDIHEAVVRKYGDAAPKMTGVNHSRLERQGQMSNQYRAAVKFLDNIEHMEKTGRVNRSTGTWTFSILIALVVGAIVGLIDYIRAKAGMKTPHIAFDANGYIVKGSLIIKSIRDNFLRSDITRTYDPVTDDDDSSGGGSSYSSSYTGSSGASHSGSGRSF